jgi:hypothetical protein
MNRLAPMEVVKPARWIKLSEEDFAPDITEFNQRIDAAPDSAALSQMLRGAARRVTQEARRELRVAKHFIAFAIDWELEGDDLEKIVKQCGATPAAIREWKNNDWL